MTQKSINKKSSEAGYQEKNSQDIDRFAQLLKGYKTKAMEDLSVLLDHHGLQWTVLEEAMAQFRRSLPELPKEVSCKAGCAYCCHLRVGVSIPEVVTIFNELKLQLTPKKLKSLKQSIIQAAYKGDTLNDAWWLSTRSACPFLELETEGQNVCRIYLMRPFSCRAYHSTDRAICQKGFENGGRIDIPCFPLFKASTDMYSTVLIQVMAQKGLFSYQVGFIRALQILFEDDTVIDQWLLGKNVFKTAELF